MVRYLIASRVPIADVLFIVAFLQGIDYLLRPAESTALLNAVEAIVPLRGWGVLFTVPGLLGFIAIRRRGWKLASICHAALVGAYAGVGIGIILSVVHAQQVWGWGPAALWLATACAHCLFALVDVWREDLLSRHVRPLR